MEGFQQGSYLSYPSLILIFKSDLLIKGPAGKTEPAMLTQQESQTEFFLVL